MTEEQAETLRAQVSDDPIPLPADHLACEGCGIAIESTEPVTRSAPMFAARATPVYFGRCPQCTRIHEAAAAYVAVHPLLLRQVGEVLAVERVESVLFGRDPLLPDRAAD